MTKQKQVVDERVVEMRFDNKQFEAGTKQTMGTLSKLKAALKLDGATKGFENLQKAANKVDMSGLGKVIDGVKVKFSALEVMAVTTLSNITNRAVNAGVQLAKSLSLDQISAGFKEYELKMGSIQTIMASTGESLGTVNKYLEELNKYSDKTIYSFSDMTQSIGKFTNAGVKLEDAVKAIQGISNEAAVSGANANEASRAMYNFAQALSSGTVKLMDWKSIELANMGTTEFKQQLIDTAVAMGTLVKETDEYQSTTTDMNGKVSELFTSTSKFNDSLSAQWLTTDVLIQTLSNYSNDIRTMTAEEKKAYEEKLKGIGYTEEQIKAIEELGIKAFNSAQDVKTFSQFLDTMKESVGSGWAQTFELIFGDFEQAKNLWTNVNNVLGAIVQESAESRNELLRGWKEAGGRDDLLAGISNSFNSFLSVVKSVKEAFSDVFPPLTIDQLVKVTKGFKDLTSKLKPSERLLNNIKRTFSGLFSAFRIGGKVAGAFAKIITPIFGFLANGILECTAVLGDWVTNLDKSIKKSDWFADKVEKIKNAIKGFVDSVGDFIDGTSKEFKILSGFDGINIDNEINSVSNSFKDLSMQTGKFNFDKVEKAFDSLKEKIKSFIGVKKTNKEISAFDEDVKDISFLDNLLEYLGRAMDVFKKFSDLVKNTMAPVFETFSSGKALGAAGGLSIIYSVVKLSKSIENFSKAFAAFSGISDVFNSLSGALGEVKNTLVAYQKDLKAEALIKVATAIAILAGALTILSFAKVENLIPAAIALSILAGVLLLGTSKLMDAANKGNKMNSALLTFSKGFKTAMSRLGRSMEIKAIGKTVKDFGQSVVMIAASIVSLGIMWRKDPEAFDMALKTVGKISTVLVGFVMLAGVGSKLANTKGMKDISKSVMSFSLALGVTVMAISKLMRLRIPEDYKVKFALLGGILGGFAALALILGAAARIAGNNQLPEMAKTIKSFAIFLLGTVVSLALLFKMKLPIDYKKKLDILAGIFKTFAGLIGVMAIAARVSGGQGFKAGSTIMAMAAFLVVVVGSLFVLSILPTDKMLKGAIGIGAVLVALGVALAGAGKIVDKNASKTVLAMAITIGAITASLAILSFIPWQDLLKSAAGLGSVLLALAINFMAISKIKTGNAFPIVIAMVASTLSITYSLFVLSEQPWQNLLAAAGSLSATLLALSACFAIISKVNVDLKSIAAVVAGSASLILIAAGISMLTKYDGQQLLNSCLALSSMLIVMVGVMAACSALSGVIGPAMVGVLGLGGVIAELGLILVAFGALAQIPGLKWIIGEGGDLLQEIGVAIGKFIGGIIGGGISGIASQLPQIGTYLSAFMSNLQGFISGSKNINAGALTNVGYLAAIIVALTVAEVVNGVASIFKMSLVKMAIELSAFMIALGPFIIASKNLKEESVKACQRIADMVLTLTKAELLSGITRMFGMSGRLSDFGKELDEFGPYIRDFAKTVENVNPEAVKGAAAAAEIMATTAKKLPAQNGFIQKVFGEKRLSDFGKELVSFGPSIRTFGIIVKDVNPEAVKGAAAAAEIMATTAKKLPAQNGFIQKVFGEKSLAEFGRQLNSFGPHIVKFAKTVEDVNPEAVKGASEAAEIMAILADNLPESESLFKKIFGGGKVTLSQFGEEINKFGTSMSTFSSTIGEYNVDNVTNAIDSFKALMELSNYVEGASPDSLVSFVNQLGLIGTDSVDNFVKAFMDSKSKAEEAIKSFSNAAIKSLKAGGVEIKTTATKVGNELCFGLQMGIKQKQPNVLTTEKILAKSMIDTLRRNLPLPTFNTIGQNTVQALINGINAKKPATLATVSNLCTAIITRFKTSLPSVTFNTIGQNVVQGVINGINAKKPLVLSTISKLCSDMIDKFKKELPDGTFKSIGENIASQIANGITSKKGEVNSATREMSDEIVDSLKRNLTGSRFREIGENAAIGLKNGITSKIEEIKNAAVEAARAAVEAAKSELQEASPSKVTHEIGEFFSLGMAKGIVNQIKAISIAGKKAADEAIEPVKNAVEGIGSIVNSEDFDMDPVIRPSIDLSNIHRGVKEISSMMNRTYDLSPVYYKAMDTASSFSLTNSQVKKKESDNSKSGEGNDYNFFQYNYSPKALSRSEIYRQTNNQFSAFRRAVNKND